MNGMMGLLLLLLSAASTYGLESVCDATQDASVCYGALGGPVILQLMRNTTGYGLWFINGKDDVLFYISGGTVKPSLLFPKSRWRVVAGNGTLIINPAESSDSGTYTVKIYTGSTWRFLGKHTVSLMIRGLESVCDATQDASVCYGALEGPVMLQLMTNTTGYHLEFRNEEGYHVFSIRQGTVDTFSRFPKWRWEVVAGIGTLIINPAARSDSGTYRVQLDRGSPRTAVGNHTVNLMIKAPMSDLDLSISCSANGEMKLNCSSNGDGPQFSWSLDGRALSEVFPDALSQTDSRSGVLTLPKVTPEVIRGHLTCSAFNHVSSINTTKPLPSCTSISPVFISVWLAEIIMLTSLHLGSCYLHMRRKRTHTAGENYEVELSPASMSRSRRRRRGLEETQEFA